MEKLSEAPGGIRLFVRTTKENYIKSFFVSVISTIIFGYFLYVKGWNSNAIFGFLFVSFFAIYRIMEYILTKKSLSLYLYGREVTGGSAKVSFVLNILLLSFFLLMSIFMVRKV